MTASIAQLTTALADRYRIERELGAGGMATVYLAHDVRHDRKVALKVLRPELSAILGAERFLAEIKTTANLQHPHILGLFDSGEAAGLVYYVMPFVEGESLRDRLKRDHQLPVEEAVRLAREVADALEYAHQQGIVHRDIKPENILLHGGHAVVADFGIALAASRSEGGARMTETGMSLGTPHYMSPEQAMGEREITPKADIYALGCVLYEMLTAEPPFVGASAQAIIGRVLTEEPRPLTAQRKTIPPNVEAAVQRALSKLPADRFASAKEFGDALARSDYTDAGTRATTAAAGSAPERVSAQVRLFHSAPWVLLVAALALYARERMRPSPTPPPIGRFALKLEPLVSSGLTGQVIALDPDGTRIVYVGTTSAGAELLTRTLGQVEPVPLAGTVGALSPFFSHDGTELAFVIGTKLVKVAVGGGPKLPIADVGNSFRGGSWNEGDTILFADENGLHFVPAAGGAPTRLAAPDSGTGETFRWPHFLPGGQAALFATNDSGVDRLAAITLSTASIKRFDVVGANPHYVKQGYVTLTVLSGLASGSGVLGVGMLVTVPFDARRLEVLGAPVPMADSVQVGGTSRTGKLGVSRTGTVAFASGVAGVTSLVIRARDGTVRDLGAPLRPYGAPRLSPNGERVAVEVADAGNDIWVFELAGRTLTRLTFERTAQRPIWSPDGRRVAFLRAGNASDLAWILADGSAPAESLVVAPGDQSTGEFTPDGRSLVIREGGTTRPRQISVVAMDSARVPRPLFTSAFQNHSPSLSPDGRWVAFVSDESGRNEIYVRPFPGPGGRWQVSKEGGNEPRWSPTGREIFFRSAANLMSASVVAGSTFAPGEVRLLFRSGGNPELTHRNYDVTRDGLSFIMPYQTRENEQTMVVLLNWFENLPARPR